MKHEKDIHSFIQEFYSLKDPNTTCGEFFESMEKKGYDIQKLKEELHNGILSPGGV